MNFDLVLQNIRELNSLTGERDCFVQPTATGAKLVKQHSVRLALYSNGMALQDGPFRSYLEPSTQVGGATPTRTLTSHDRLTPPPPPAGCSAACRT